MEHVISMKAEWKEFLENRGAEFDGNGITGFGNSKRETQMVYSGDVMVDLSHFGLVSAHGDDSESFLQGQVTCDCTKVTSKSSQLAAICNQKGRVMTFMRLFQQNSTLYLHMPADRIEDTLSRLRMYIMRAKTTLEDVSDNFVSIGLSGPNAESLLQSSQITVPDNVNDSTQKEGLCIIRVAGPHPRFILFGTLDVMKKLWTELDVHAAPAGPSVWQLLDIQSGIPVIYTSTSELFVPQMINLQIIDAINFKKGCYTGQEVVARMQYLGKLKKQMYIANITDSDAPLPGTKLYSAAYSETQSCGQIVNAQITADGSHDVLAVVDIKAHTSGDVHLEKISGPELGFKTLPYAFPVQAEN